MSGITQEGGLNPGDRRERFSPEQEEMGVRRKPVVCLLSSLPCASLPLLQPTTVRQKRDGGAAQRSGGGGSGDLAERTMPVRAPWNASLQADLLVPRRCGPIIRSARRDVSTFCFSRCPLWASPSCAFTVRLDRSGCSQRQALNPFRRKTV